MSYLYWAIGITGAVLLRALESGPLDPPFAGVTNPYGFEGAGFDGGVNALQVGIVLIVLAMAVSLWLRFRRASNDARQQIKWFVASVSVLGMAFAVSPFFYDSSVAAQVGVTIAMASVPVATAIAILRYRLYEIDRIVNRTIVYGLVTVLLGGVYAGVVVAFDQMLNPLTQGKGLAVAASTLIVAALFRPVRRRIQALVDRRFYRRRYDAQRTLDAFSSRLRDEFDLDALGAELSSVVRETMQPAHVSFWLRAPEAER